MPDRCEDAFDGIGRTQVIPVLGGEVVERKQCFAILRQAFDRLAVLGAVFLGKDIDRRFGGGPAWRPADLAQVLLHVRLHRERDLVQDVHGLVHPTPLMPRAGILALEGRVQEHHRFLLTMQLRRLEAAEQDISTPDQRIDPKLEPYRATG